MLLQKTKNRGVKEAIKELNLVNASDKLRARYEAKLKARRDRNAEDAYVLEQGIEQGIERGIEKGITQGEAYFAALTEKLLQDGRLEDLAKITKDQDYREQLYREYGMKSPASEKKLRNDK